MAMPIKCPLCGNILEPVGKKGKKMRCEKCRSVFDVPQLHSYYGIGASGQPASMVHEYETPHMHAMEVQRQVQQQAAQQAPPPPQPQPVQTSIFSGQPQAAPVATSEKPQNAPVKKGGSTAVKVIFWLIIIAVIAAPFIGDIVPAVEDFFFGKSGIVQQHDSRSSSVSSASSTRSSTAASSGSVAGVSGKGSAASSNYQALGPGMNLSATARLAKDGSGTDVLIVEYQWTNDEDYDTAFGVAVRTSATQNGTTMTGAYPKNGIGGYDGDLRYKQVGKGQSGTAMEAFSLIKSKAEGTVVVSAYSWSDVLNMDDPPAYTWEFDLASL